MISDDFGWFQMVAALVAGGHRRFLGQRLPTKKTRTEDAHRRRAQQRAHLLFAKLSLLSPDVQMAVTAPRTPSADWLAATRSPPCPALANSTTAD
eukprot:997664-Prorocentrum_minimum.AAC.1